MSEIEVAREPQIQVREESDKSLVYRPKSQRPRMGRICKVCSGKGAWATKAINQSINEQSPEGAKKETQCVEIEMGAP